MKRFTVRERHNITTNVLGSFGNYVYNQNAFTLDAREIFRACIGESNWEMMCALQKVKGMISKGYTFDYYPFKGSEHDAMSRFRLIVRHHRVNESGLPDINATGEQLSVNPELYAEFHSWIRKALAFKVLEKELAWRLENITTYCNTAGQIHRVWPALTPLIGSLGQGVINAKAASAKPWIIDGDRAEKFYGGAFKTLDSILAVAPLLPVVDTANAYEYPGLRFTYDSNAADILRLMP